MTTKIEWCDETINPFVGCTRISPGCENCYAIRFAWRHQAMFGDKDERYRGLVHQVCPFCGSSKINDRGDGIFTCEEPNLIDFDDPACGNGRIVKPILDWTGKVSFFPERLAKIPGGEPKRIFIGSMGDLFCVNAAKIDVGILDRSPLLQTFGAIMTKPQHTYIVLTKRPERMFRYFYSRNCYDDFRRRIPNLYLGVTVENQDQLWSVEELLKLRAYAKVLFVSVEPMLGAVEVIKKEFCYRATRGAEIYCDDGICLEDCDEWQGVDWVICGPETGPGKREFKEEWALDLQQQCASAGVPFFFKGGLLGGQRYEEFPR